MNHGYVKKEVPKLSNKNALDKIEKTKMASVKTGYMADGAVLPNGNVIKTAKGDMYSLAPKDVVSIGQPGSNSGGGTSSGNFTINGTLRLDSGNSSMNIDFDKLSASEKQQLVQIVVAGMK